MPIDREFPVPVAQRFVAEDGTDIPFIEAPQIEDAAQRLIAEQPLLRHLGDRTVRYFWKAKGGTEHGAPIRGKAMKPGGLLKHYSDADFIVWIAADHTRSIIDFDQMDALIYHELLHCGENEDGKPMLYPHDLEIFNAEIKAFGLHTIPMRVTAKVFHEYVEEAIEAGDSPF